MLILVKVTRAVAYYETIALKLLHVVCFPVTAPECTVAAPECTVAAPECTVVAPECTVAAPACTVVALAVVGT